MTGMLLQIYLEVNDSNSSYRHWDVREKLKKKSWSFKFLELLVFGYLINRGILSILCYRCMPLTQQCLGNEELLIFVFST